jgi:hypothetical protein
MLVVLWAAGDGRGRLAILAVFRFFEPLDLALFDLFVGADLADVGGGDVVGEEDAVEVIDLVLEDAREPAFGLDADLFAMRVARFDGDGRGAGHVVADDTGDAEAAFGPQDGVVAALDDFGVD